MLGSFDDAEDAVQEAWLRLSRNESSGIANLGGWLTTPAERLAFVLHDLFALPFDEIALIIGRSSEAARQLASRARRRVQGAGRPETDLGRQRELVDAFVAAAHGGDFDALIRVLDPEVVLRADRDPASRGIRGSVAVAEQAVGFARLVQRTESVIINGAPGIVSWLPNGKPMAILAFILARDRIAEIYVISSPERVEQLLDYRAPSPR